jgi:hypothetical protein
MTEIQIPTVIRPALRSELFGANDAPFKNAVFFTKKTNESCYCGPYTVLANVNQSNFIYRYIFRELYIIITEGEGFCFLMNLRVADKDDVIEGNNLRYHYLYYVKEPRGVFSGPYMLTKETDIYYIAQMIAQNSIYVVSENQSFIPFTLQKTA